MDAREICALIDRVFRCDQISAGAPDREKLRFDFMASRGPLAISMNGLRWTPEVISAYNDAEREATERTLAAELQEESL